MAQLKKTLKESLFKQKNKACCWHHLWYFPISSSVCCSQEVWRHLKSLVHVLMGNEQSLSCGLSATKDNLVV